EFRGKKHSEGGMPVNLPEGSFIFSDSKKLKIKDRELLKSTFGIKNPGKDGMTPAQISKRFKLNDFIQNLQSDDTDEITKRSSHLMLEKNVRKLAETAMVQEAMK